MQTTVRAQKVRRRAGFTLIEIVVVVLLIGIIAATAAPRMFDTATDARQNTTLQSLNVVRDAIELYKAQEGSYPGSAGTGTALAVDLKPYLKGPFPKQQMRGTPDASVKYVTGTGLPAPDGLTDWQYNTADGSFGINDSTYADY